MEFSEVYRPWFMSAVYMVQVTFQFVGLLKPHM